MTRPAARRTLRALALALVTLVCGAASAESPTGAPEDWPEAMHEPLFRTYLLAEQLEFRDVDGEDAFAWEVEGWIGSATHRLWVETEGELRSEGPRGGDAELQLLYGRILSPFWDLQLGVRQDWVYGADPERERSFAVLGLRGLAPFWIEAEPAVYLSDDGDLSFRLTATSEWLLTQRLVAEPRFELNVAAHDVRNYGIERGFESVELGLRLRYEIRREIAPYVGVHWERRLGNTADLARRLGDDVDELGAVIGLRLWY